jgi:glycerol-3-phosphate acyltransferase PlsY
MEFFYLAVSYLSGAIPFGLILSRLFGDGKLTEKGSRNIGATNAMRTQGKFIGISTFLLDFLKGFVPYSLLRTQSEPLDLLILAAPVIGHMFPVWLKFHGGKGIATYFGILAALNPFVCFGTLLVWTAMFLITRISAAAGLLSVTSSLIIFNYARVSLCLDFLNHLYVLIGLVVLIFIKHHENIKQFVGKEHQT